jgi:FO synthase
MAFPGPDRDLAIDLLEGRTGAGGLFAEACRLARQGKGDVITYSRKVFVPVTTLCRNRCEYCTFHRTPEEGGRYLEPEEALEVAVAGAAKGCTEAMLTMGDKPELRWAEARAFLDRHGHVSTIAYAADLAGRILEETSLFPHVNPGVMDDEAFALLRPVSPSMGMMLESASERLTEPGMAHGRSPDKHPAVRIETIRAAGRQRVPFTTGLLLGIGETAAETVDSLFLLADLQQETGAIQEVIIQNFRAKEGTPMADAPEPSPELTATVAALARWILGPSANLQVPPNLTERFERYLDAGINDWGGVSPVTPDWVNPESPWPRLQRLRARTEEAGFRLAQRLPVYPEYISEEWIDAALLPRLRAAADEDGYALESSRAVQ